MHHEARRLVEHREVFVFVYESQVGVCGRVGGWRRLGAELHVDFRAALEQARRRQRASGAGHEFVGDEASGLRAGDSELIGEEAVEALGGARHDAKDDGHGSAACASLVCWCARPSCQSESASATAPTVIAESATLNVGQRHPPTPMSTKSTTPSALRT